MKKEEIIKSIERIGKISEELVQTKEEIKDDQLERYFCKLEKTRMDMYDAARQRNLWIEFMDDKGTEFIDDHYKAEVENEILKIYIPERIPAIKKGANYTQKRIMQNVSRIARKYEELFYDKFTMVLIKIYDDGKIWDADNRNVKPIHDGLIHGKIIRDDNIYCTCYMVQGYYSDKPHAEVYVLPADEITRMINQKLR